MIPKSGTSAGEGIGYPFQYSWASLVAQLVKNPPAVQETWVRSLGWHIPWRRESLPSPASWAGEFHGLYSPWGCKESDTTERLSLSLHFYSQPQVAKGTTVPAVGKQGSCRISRLNRNQMLSMAALPSGLS